MSYAGRLTSETKLIIKNENIVPLLETIQNYNRIWKIDKFDKVQNIEQIFSVLGLKGVRNDYTNEVVVTEGYFYDMLDDIEEIIKVLARYVEENSILEIFYEDYNTMVKYVFKNKEVKKYSQETVWKEV